MWHRTNLKLKFLSAINNLCYLTANDGFSKTFWKLIDDADCIVKSKLRLVGGIFAWGEFPVQSLKN